jgi:hypothetical protein
MFGPYQTRSPWSSTDGRARTVVVVVVGAVVVTAGAVVVVVATVDVVDEDDDAVVGSESPVAAPVHPANTRVRAITDLRTYVSLMSRGKSYDRP